MTLKKSEGGETMFSILFYGSLWGIAEATLGYLVHLLELAPGISGGIMFPVAFYFLRKAYLDTGRLSSVLPTAAVAALIKLSGLLLPHLRPIKTLNPAMAIMIEAAMVLVFFSGFGRNRSNAKVDLNFPRVMLMSLSWRTLYLIASVPVFFLFYDGFIQYGAQGIAQFLTWGTVINSSMILAYIRISGLRKSERLFHRIPRFRPAIGILALTAALFIEQTLLRL
jgi:hypothetical protein